MRLSALLVIPLVIGPAAAQEPASPSVEDLFPLAVGNTWTYRVNGQAERFVVRVAGPEMVGPQTCYKLEATLADRLVATEHLAFTKAGLCRFRAEQEDIDPPVCILKLPAGKGTRWEAKYTLNMRSATGTFTATAPTGDVSVPAGKFRAVKVDAGRRENPRGFMDTTVWYAPGVGPVRQWIYEGKSRLELELERFDRAGEK